MAADIAPRSTGSSGTPVGTTRGRAGKMRATPAATRSASTVPPARPTSPPSTTGPGVEHGADGGNPDRDPVRDFVQEARARPTRPRQQSGLHRRGRCRRGQPVLGGQPAHRAGPGE